MKCTISCDALLERDLAVETVQLLTELFEPDEIFSLTHQPGQILGPIEQRRISSSLLSHKVKSKREILKWLFLVPTAAKKLSIPCRFDIVFNVSSGLSQGISKCKKTKQITYLLKDADLLFEDIEKTNWRGRFFAERSKKWALKALAKTDELWVSSSHLKHKYEKILDRKVEVVYPFVKLDDFPVITAPIFKYDYYVLVASSLSLDQARSWLTYLMKRNDKFTFVGSDDHLNELKKEHTKMFFGDRCAGELAPLLAGSRLLICGNQENFPRMALCGLSTGRPVLAQRGGQAEEFFKEIKYGVSYFDTLADLISTEQLNSIERHEKIEPKLLHTQVQKFGDLKFKHLVRRYIAKIEKP